jgi:hypothetical protein
LQQIFERHHNLGGLILLGFAIDKSTGFAGPTRTAGQSAIRPVGPAGRWLFGHQLS